MNEEVLKDKAYAIIEAACGLVQTVRLIDEDKLVKSNIKLLLTRIRRVVEQLEEEL